MPKGLRRSISRGPATLQTVRRDVIRLGGQVTVDGATGVGDGQLVIADFPEGFIKFHGAFIALILGGTGAQAGLTDTWNGDFGVGTTADTDDALATTDVNIIPSTALGPAVDEVAPLVRVANGTDALFDNTDGSLEVNLNVLVDDVSISADGIVLGVQGHIQLLYSMLGDD